MTANVHWARFNAERDSQLLWVKKDVVLDFDSDETAETLEAENAYLRTEVGRLKSQLAALEVLADTDGLTGLLNRRAFARELERAISAHARYGFSTALAYADVRGLKLINDTLGHAAGDDAIRYVAGALAGGVRSTDIVGRLGGDEFGIILTHLDEDAARTRCHALAQAVQSTPVPFAETSICVRLRFGMTMIGEGDCSRSVLGRADMAMYASSRAQRSDR